MTVWMHILDEPPPPKFRFLGRERDFINNGDRVALVEEYSGKRFTVHIQLWELEAYSPSQIADLVMAKAGASFRTSL